MSYAISIVYFIGNRIQYFNHNIRIVCGTIVAGVTSRKKFIIVFWIVFVLLFIVSHKFLASIIIDYQHRPAIETQEAYELMMRYQQPVLAFYKQYQRCPLMADKSLIITEVEAYHYVKTIRFLEDATSKTCFINVVMRDDTPSKAVKGRLLTIAYQANRLNDNWYCYTNIESKYTVSSCRHRPLPQNFLQVIKQYEQSISDG